MTNGTPVRSLHKFDSKGNLSGSPLGWSGIITPAGKFDQLRKLDSANDRMEIWLGWNTKKACWQYYKRIIPTREALLGVKRMGLPWRGTANAPDYLLKLLERTGEKDLMHLICGTLPPHAVKVASFRKGDVFLLSFPLDDKEGGNGAPPITTWGEITAIKQAKVLEFKSITNKNTKALTKANPEDLVSLLGIPKAAEQASALGLTPPV